MADDLKDVIQNIFDLQTDTHTYPGPQAPEQLVKRLCVEVIANRIAQTPCSCDYTLTHTHTHTRARGSNRQSLTLSLKTLQAHTEPNPQLPANSPAHPPQVRHADELILNGVHIPPEIIDYVDSSRNPDIYTREFVELVQRGNQDLKGKAEAFAGFRDALAREMMALMPETSDEVERTVRATGGNVA